MIDDDNKEVGSIVHKSGFRDELTSQYAVIGILHKLLIDEQANLNRMLKAKQDFDIKRSTDL